MGWNSSYLSAYNNKVEAMLKVLNENDNLLFRYGGKEYPSGGRFIRTKLTQESPMMYQPMMPVYPDVSIPIKYEPEPDYGDYEYPTSMGMIRSMPIQTGYVVPAPQTGVLQEEALSAPVDGPEIDLFSDEAVARRALKQRWAESSFNDKAVSKAGAQGAWQIMPITLKDYMGRGRGKKGDLNDPEYNRKVRDWVMGIIPRDLQDLYSEDDAPMVRLAKIYGAYNWGAGNMRKYLRKRRDAGEDISNSVDWVEGLNPETRRYIKYLAFDEDIPDSTAYTNAAFEKAAADRGLFSKGGGIHIKPENRGKFTALLKRTGKSASWFKKYGTPLQRKRATFALNARKWHHGDGGLLKNYFEDGGPEGKPAEKIDVLWNDINAYTRSKDYDYGKRQEMLNDFWNLQDAVAKQTLEKYPGIASADNYSWSSTDEGARKYLIGHGVHESGDAKDVVDFYNSYVQSPGFDRILDNQLHWYRARHPYRKFLDFPGTGNVKYHMRKAAERPVTTFNLEDGYPEMSFYRPWNGYAFVYRPTIERTDVEHPYRGVLGHEIGHHYNAIDNGQKDALDINKGYENDGHDNLYSERHADVLAMKYLLYRHGIYDSRGKDDVTAEQVSKLRKMYPKFRIFLQMKSDEDIAKMLNLVADSGEKESLYGNHLGNISAMGGILERYDADSIRQAIQKLRTGQK